MKWESTGECFVAHHSRLVGCVAKIPEEINGREAYLSLRLGDSSKPIGDKRDGSG